MSFRLASSYASRASLWSSGSGKKREVRRIRHGRPERRPFLPPDVFEIAGREIAVAAIVACDLHRNREVSEADYERLLTAAQRLDGIAKAAYGR